MSDTTTSKRWTPLRWIVRGLIVLILAMIGFVYGAAWYCTSMPGTSHERPLQALSPVEETVRDRAQAHVRMLATQIGARNDDHPEAYRKAQKYLEDELKSYGYEVALHEVKSGKDTWFNVEATRPGKSKEVVVFGAHYDSCFDTPGADDNASGVAALLELARLMSRESPEKTLHFAFFANEEPPHFQRRSMGSLQYAKMARERGDNIHVMYSLEMLGFYTTEPNSQKYPPIIDMFYPTTGDFVAFVSSLEHRALTRDVVSKFRERAAFPSQGFAGPTFVQGIDYSDHWSFWQHGFPAIMVTDTSFFRTPHYHQPTDVPETLDFERLARVVTGLKALAQHD